MNKNIKSINLTFGYLCNNNCIHCNIGYDARSKVKDRSTEYIKKEILDAKKQKVEQIIFIGGEVTIRLDFFEILEFAKSNGMKVHLETNGRMFSDRTFAKKTFEIMPNLDIAMSFHHTEHTIQDKITGIDGSFRQSVTGIKNMKLFGLKNLIIICVITRYNYKNLSTLVTFLKNLNVDGIDFTLLRIGGNAQKNINELFIDITSIQPYLFKAIGTGNEQNMRIKTYGFPYCTLNGYILHAYEINFLNVYIDGNTYIFNEPNDCKSDWQKERLNIKAKSKNCKKCIYFNLCEGVWCEYFSQDINELIPIKKKNEHISAMIKH